MQLHLVNPGAPYFQGAQVLLAADCCAFASGDFHGRFLKGKTLAVACPKLDQGQEIYLQKLVAMIDHSLIDTLTVLASSIVLDELRREAHGGFVEKDGGGARHQRAADGAHLLFPARSVTRLRPSPFFHAREILIDHVQVGIDLAGGVEMFQTEQCRGDKVDLAAAGQRGLAIGEHLIVLLGTMDVSLASILTLTGVAMAALLVNFGLPPIVAAVLVLGVGALAGLVNGLIITLLVVAVVVLLVERSFRGAPPPEETVVTESADRSIAVLPFDNRSNREEDEFFTEGIHDDLLTTLARIGSLKVISRTSVMRYKDARRPLAEMAREMDVDALVEEMGRTGALEKRAQLAKEMNDMLMQDFVILPLVDRGRVSAHSNRLGGVRLNIWDSELWNIADWYRID